ncbi:MAG: hypothetical protein ACXWV2_08345 [Chitinophagaceae bacterium]
MYHDNFGTKYLKMGQFTCRAVFILGLVYAVTTLLGLVSLKSPDEPIGNPYFTIMELLILVIAPLMAISMVAVHYYTTSVDKIYSLAAVFFMFLMAGITSGVHFIILTVNYAGFEGKISNFSFFFSFKWFSIVYVLDILAWDWFFGISFLLASRVFKSGRLENLVRSLMVISGVLSIAGLIGVSLQNMQLRNIGIIGYAVIAPVAFLLIGKVLGRLK